jgi:SagB-type dehydrogenase family enzyme
MKESATQRYIQANVRPPDLRDVNWHAAPLPFKLYRDCEQIPCGSTEQAPVSTEGDSNGLSLSQIGQMLADIYGYTRQKDHLPPFPFLYRDKAHTLALDSSLLRPVPSGGALFPCELYLLVGPGSKDMRLPEGIYHYDAAHHALDILRQGDCSALLQKSLAHPTDLPPLYTLFLTSFFWKDGFKYGAFSYRLQGLDIGTVIAQAEIVTRHVGLEARVHYQFLDRAIDDLLGLNPMQESVYAVMTWGQALHQPRQSELDEVVGSKVHVSTPEEPLVKPVEEAKSLQSIAAWPLAEAVHLASFMETREAFHPLQSLVPIQPPEGEEGQHAAEASALQGGAPRGEAFPPSVSLHDLAPAWVNLSGSESPLDLWGARNERRSADGFFGPKPLTEQQVSQLLCLCMSGVANDLDGRLDLLQHTLLYCVIRRVQDIPSGVYRYQPERHALKRVQAWETTHLCEKMRDLSELKHFYTSLSLFLVGNVTSGFEVYGDRWYRMQHMEAGVIAQRLSLAAAALKLACRASLGFQVPETNTFLGLSEEYTSLLHLMVAAECSTYQQYEQSLRMWIERYL